MQKNTKKQEVTMEAVAKLLDEKLDQKLQEQNKELRSVIQEEIRFSEARTDSKLEKMERRIDDNAQKYRDEILTREDKTMGELEIIRQEQLIMGKEIDELKQNAHN